MKSNYSYKSKVVFGLLMWFLTTMTIAFAQTSGKDLEYSLIQKIDQTNNKEILQLMLLADSEADISSTIAYLGKIENHISVVQDKFKLIRNERKYLERIFYYTQKSFLKEYHIKSSLFDLFENGSYDCVTATGLMAYIFEQLGYQVDIIELDHHVYAKINGENTYLIESTDLAFGFAWKEKRIREIEANYRNPNQNMADEKAVGSIGNGFGELNIDELIGLKELAGIQYFNLALESFENQDYIKAFNTLEKGIKIYNNKRKEDFMGMIISEILSNDKISQQLKVDYLKKYVDKMKPKAQIKSR